MSNYAIYRLARARVCIKKEDLGGEENVDKFVSAYAFAAADPFRAATNNKGVMNGMIPVVVATGNDTRAVESGAILMQPEMAVTAPSPSGKRIITETLRG